MFFKMGGCICPCSKWGRNFRGKMLEFPGVRNKPGRDFTHTYTARRAKISNISIF